ncbi:MAG: hypothetical protein N2205_01490 [Candidatus Caldatribacterium sp.]|uniref:hypothetical protein n=1 Tax=Candidatus Caldatribacterium sp. TaxID=2282143 RepID=UPI002995F7E6|nr:hypothetical protein [Candidatus Caldatribacterium sp.]MCX7729876.1 hypothetical protein [Candidatus Caldatribacterium sp.]MDW8080668.1 hypothetical protein [Candidatus Calescibacterium sp.]
MLLGILLVVLVLYGLLLFWVVNERLKEIHALLRSLLKREERERETVWGLSSAREEEGGERWSVADERFPVYTLEDEVLRRKGEEK